jgi:hypothetical protein
MFIDINLLGRSWQEKRVVWTDEIVGFARPDEDILTDAIPLAEINRIRDTSESTERFLNKIDCPIGAKSRYVAW